MAKTVENLLELKKQIEADPKGKPPAAIAAILLDKFRTEPDETGP